MRKLSSVAGTATRSAGDENSAATSHSTAYSTISEPPSPPSPP